MLNIGVFKITRPEKVRPPAISGFSNDQISAVLPPFSERKEQTIVHEQYSIQSISNDSPARP